MKTRFAFLLGAAPLACARTAAVAQSQPATIATSVALAMSLEPDFFGRPQFFDARVPTRWPTALVPAGAKVVGGGSVGDASFFGMQAAVFEFSPGSDPASIIKGLLTQAGYLYKPAERPTGRDGGFAGNVSPPGATPARYCKAGSMVTFAAVDSVAAPLVVGINVLEGEPARQNCESRPDRASMASSFPIDVPSLTPPAGTVSFPGGSSWGDSRGSTTSSLRTTLGVDSLLPHYSSQLVRGGWKAEGRPAVADGVAVQRFSFEQGQKRWTASLIIMSAGDRRDLILQFARID